MLGTAGTARRSHLLFFRERAECWEQLVLLGGAIYCSSERAECWEQLVLLGGAIYCSSERVECWEQLVLLGKASTISVVHEENTLTDKLLARNMADQRGFHYNSQIEETRVKSLGAVIQKLRLHTSGRKLSYFPTLRMILFVECNFMASVICWPSVASL